MNTDAFFDVIIIGGGIVGLATAYQLGEKWPKLRVALIEKEEAVGQHQSGHNSGVMHSGIYYKPGSLKAKNCLRGHSMMREFCEREQISYEICGKVIVAVEEEERAALRRIYDRGQENGVRCEKIGREELGRLEPSVRGIEALHVPEAGIADYPAVCQRLADRIQEGGHRLLLGQRVTRIERVEGEHVVRAGEQTFRCRHLVGCAGLYSDRVARCAGIQPDVCIIPFRGEYYRLKPDKKDFCRNLIYPVPDPRFPFLGVHLTRMVDATVECGPNAVLALAREGYRRTDINVSELMEFAAYAGLRRLVWKHWRPGMQELLRSVSKRAFARALQRLVPDLRAIDLEAAPAGVRAQAVRPDGGLVDDFELLERDGALHVVNAPSPAATSALSIGEHVVERMGVLPPSE
ncbi:MAG: L-2-hydroxyglutarate oxidase [Nannocystaceae bacterium]